MQLSYFLLFSFLLFPTSGHAQETYNNITVFVELKEGTGSPNEEPLEVKDPHALKIRLFFPENFNQVIISPLKIEVFPVGWADKKTQLRTGRNTLMLPENLAGLDVNLAIMLDDRFVGMIRYSGENKTKEFTVTSWKPVRKPKGAPDPRRKTPGRLREVGGETEEDYTDRNAESYEIPLFDKDDDYSYSRIYWHFMIGFGRVIWPDYIETEIDWTEANAGTDISNPLGTMEIDIGVYWKLPGGRNDLLGFNLMTSWTDSYYPDSGDDSLYIALTHGPIALSYVLFPVGKPYEGWFLRVDMGILSGITYQNDYRVNTDYHTTHGFSFLGGFGYALGFGAKARMTYEFHVINVMTSDGSATGMTFGIGTMF